MTPEDFVRSRPCLEEIDGYLSAGNLTAEGMKVIEEHRRRVMKGKAMPALSRLPRAYSYQRNRQPTRLARPAVERRHV